MKVTKQVLENRFKKFFSSITKKDRVAVIHHTDPDGVCSGVIAAKLVERLRGKKIDLRLNQKGNVHFITKQTYKKLKAGKINKVIITDLTVDETPAYFKKIEKFADTLVLDHHAIYRNFNSKKTIMIKPQMFCKIPPNTYTASKLTYDFGCSIADITDLDWIAAVGLIGDIAARSWKAWLTNVFKKYKIKTNKDLFKTGLGEVAILISSAESYDVKNVKLSFDILYNSESYKNVLKSKLNRFRKIIDDEITYYLHNIKKQAIFEGDFIYYEIQPRYHTKSPLSTILGLKYPHKSIIVVDTRQNPISISARRNDAKLKINHLLKDAAQGIKGVSGGGHAVSAGALIPKKSFCKFKINLFRLLRKEVKQ
ncbi:MAG: DHHA1 domain-containing protein [Candidatus Woesearchaeota archaeon]